MAMVIKIFTNITEDNSPLHRIYFVFTALILLCSGCQQASRFETTVEMMGTELAITIIGREDAQEQTGLVITEMQRINQLMSLWIKDSPLSQLNRTANEGWTETDAEIIDLLREAITYSVLTNGAFDVTAGPLIRLWGFFARENQRRPDRAEIEANKLRIGYKNIEIDANGKRIRFNQSGMEIDFGGIAKGYAIDQSLAILKKNNVENALVNLGGNIGFVGTPRQRDFWTVAVRDPRKSSGLLGYLKLGRNFETWGVASSGQYERYFEYEGKRYGHIIDPRTGWPVEGVLGTTVIADSALKADILSTSTYIIGPEAAQDLLINESALGLLILSGDNDKMIIRISSELAERFELLPSIENTSIETF